MPGGITLEEMEPCEPGATYVPNGNPRFILPPRVYQWTAYEFLNRFTGTEREAIRTEAKTNPNVADFLMLATAAQVIISDDPVTVAGMGYLVSIGLITDQRKNEILDGSL